MQIIINGNYRRVFAWPLRCSSFSLYDCLKGLYSAYYQLPVDVHNRRTAERNRNRQPFKFLLERYLLLSNQRM